VPAEDSTPYSRAQLVGSILGAVFGTGVLLLCIVYYLRRRTNSRYTPVRGDQDTAAAEFNLSSQQDSQPQLNLEPITSRSQYVSHPTRDMGPSSALYPTWSSTGSSGRARDNYPRITVTSPTTIPSASSFSTESHRNVSKSRYDSQQHLASLTREDTTYTAPPPRPSSPIPNGHARFGYVPVEESDEEEIDMMHDPTAPSDAPNLNSKRSYINKRKHGTLPAVPVSSTDTPRPSHTRTESRDPLIQTDVAPQSTRPRPEQQLQPHPQSRPHIQSNLQPTTEPPKTRPLAPLIPPPPFPPPSHPLPNFPAIEEIRDAASYDPTTASRTDNQPPAAPQDQTHFSAQAPPIPVGIEMGTLKSQPSGASMDQPVTNPSPILILPSTSYQVTPRQNTKLTEISDRSQTQTWYSNIESTGSPSHQYSLDSPLPSSRLSHVPHGDRKDSPAKSLSPDSITTPSISEFPIPPGASPLQHTKSDPSPPTSVARSPRSRTKSALSNVIATAADIKVKNNGVAIQAVLMPPTRPMPEGSRSDSPNGAISNGNMSGLMGTESQVRPRKPITPDFFDPPKAEQKKSEPGTDSSRERVGMDVSLFPMFLAGSLQKDGTSTEGRSDQPGGRAENLTQPRREGDAEYRESLNSYASFVTDDETGTLEQAEIKTAELATRPPPTNVPELARWDTIHQMSDPEERARARSRSGSNATATENPKKRKSPDDSPPPMPPLPVDAKERPGDASDSSSRATSTIEGQLVAIPMSFANRNSPLVPWTPSPAATPLRLETAIHSALPQTTTFEFSGRAPWQPLRFHSPPRDEQRSPATPPSVPPIPELAPISFEDLLIARPPIQETDESPALAEEQSAQAEPAVVTVREASPCINSEVNESGWQPGHTSDSSIHSQGTADTFGLSATKSLRGVSRRGPRPIPYHDREPSGSGASITTISHQNTGSHGTSGRSHGASGSGSQNDPYGPTADYIFGPPPPVLEQPEPDTSSESHVSVPATRELSPKVPPIVLVPPVSPPISASPPQTNADTFSSSRASNASTVSGLSRPRAQSTRPGVGAVRGPRERSSSARAVLPSSSSASQSYSMEALRPFSSTSSVSASHAQPSDFTPSNAAGSSNPKTDSTLSHNSLLDLYTQSPTRSNTSIPGSPLLSKGHLQSHPS
jgi:hypothetical protein